MTDDQSSSRAPIPCDDYPIVCAQCNYNLRGLPDPGRCPECGTSFDHADDRALYLFEQHGPEAFLPRDWQDDLKQQPRGWRAFGHSFGAILIALGLLVVITAVDYAVCGTIRILNVIIIWIILLTPIELIFARSKAKNEPAETNTTDQPSCNRKGGSH